MPRNSFIALRIAYRGSGCQTVAARLDRAGLSPYHSTVAVRKKPVKKDAGPSNVGCLLMLAFLLAATVLLLFNRENIARVLKNTQFVERMLKPPPEKAPAAKPEPAPAPAPVPPAPQKPREKPPAETAPEKPAPQPKEAPKPAPAPTAPEPAVKAPAPEAKPPAERTKPAARERNLWFVRVESDGVIARVRTKRSLAASDSPLADALNSLLKGPTDAEKKKGYSSLIPAGARLLSATVRGSTAYLSFNEDFQFNPFGIEGYAAQLRQIVWTATEFESVADVQILIEGRRVDYLGAEGIFIGSPLSRETLQ